jgi:hypothetical protein
VVPLVPLELKEIGETLDRKEQVVPLVVVEMLALKDVSEPPEIKDLKALLEKRVI